MADQDQTTPTYTEEEMAAFEQYEKDLATYNQEAKTFKENKESAYDLYPEIGSTIGAGIPLTGAVASGAVNLSKKAIKTAANLLADRPSAGERWGEAVGGPGGKTVDEAVRNREIAKSIKPGEIVTKEGVIIPESAAPKAAPKVAPKVAKQVFMDPEELNFLRRTGLLRKVLAGAGTGFDIGDAYKRYQQGDTTGAIISGLGALGYPISKIPHPAATGIGYGMMFGAPALNQYRDTHKPIQRASGGLTYLKKPVSHFAKGGEAGVLLEALGEIKNAVQEAKAIKAGEKAASQFTPRPTVNMKLSEALGSHEGKKLILTQSDNYGVHGGRRGGNQFSNFQNIEPLAQAEEVVWMNDTPQHANSLIKLGGDNSIVVPYIGRQDQLKSNRSVWGDVMKSHYDREKYLTPEQFDLINNRIKTVKESGELVFPQPFDIRDKFATQELGGDTFARRGVLSSMLGEGEGVGRTKNGIALPTYQEILQANRDPLTIGQPTTSVGSRLFTVDPTRPSQYDTRFNPNYNWTVYGKDLGVNVGFTPPEHAIAKYWNDYIKRTGKVPSGKGMFGYNKNAQDITHDYLMNLEKAGYAKGGEVGIGLEALSEIKAAIQEAKAASKVNAQLTQRNNTVPTYSKSGNILVNRGVEGPVIDFGSGLGLGTEELRRVLPSVHDYEPLAIEGYKPKFTIASDIPSDTYQGLVNHSVLNVLPKDIRDQAMFDIGRVIQPGGTGIITARTPNAVLGAKGISGGEPNSIITQGPRGSTFQKGFSTQDLLDYANYILGKKFDISPAPTSDLGRLSGSSIMIQKKAEGGEVEFTNKYGTTVGQDEYGNQVLPQPSELDLLKEMVPDMSTLKAIPKASSILSRKIAEEAKKEWNKSGPRAIPDIALNTAGVLGGSISDLISGFSPSLNKGEETNPMLGVGQEKEKPNLLGAEQIHDFLREKGITKDDYPLAENALLLGGPSLLKRAPGLISKAADLTEGLPVGMSIKDVSPRFTSNKVQFTSPLEDALNVFPKRIESMPGEQWSGWLRNQPANVKKEAEAIGLQDKLASKSNISKNDLLEHVKGESPRISRKVLNDDVWVEQHPEGDFYIANSSGDIAGERFYDYNDAMRASQKYNPQYATEALSLPGGKNYREILLSNPWNKSPSGKDFKQGHFPDTPNLLAHLRVTDRTSAEGKPALFVEEVQSDWGQTGRKTGFDAKPFPRDITPEELKANHYHELNADQKRWMGDFDNEMERVIFNKDESGYENLLDKFSRWTDMQNEKRVIPGGPYVKDTKDWTSLGLKHAIKEAIENKKDQVAWTTGAQQNFRNMKEAAPKGMEDFYDKIMHQSANDLLKKLGAKERVRPIEFDLGDQLPPQAFGDRPEYFDPNEIIPAHRSKQWGFDITPEMKQKILNEGLPKFDKGGKVSMAEMRAQLGKRLDNTDKETGFLGMIPTAHPGEYMTELSVGMPGTDELFRPSIVPNMHPAIYNYMAQTGIVPEEAYPISQKHAELRIHQGKSPFWNKKEDQ